ncbi:hypothetical protein QQ73_15115, partial [Candidatus Endoriftia persephone str. Guaymas]|nr:hypothetical protein [Candidatus Endoriftia persephone str. Guaymas]
MVGIGILLRCDASAAEVERFGLAMAEAVHHHGEAVHTVLGNSAAQGGQVHPYQTLAGIHRQGAGGGLGKSAKDPQPLADRDLILAEVAAGELLL